MFHDNDILAAYMELTDTTSMFEAINMLDWCDWDIELALETHNKYSRKEKKSE